MSISAAILLIAQASSVQTVSDAPERREPIWASATASTRVLAPTVIHFADGKIDQGQDAAKPQRNTDDAGRSWIEFS